MRKRLQFVHARGGGVLRDHQATLQTRVAGQVGLHRIHAVESAQHPEAATLADACDVAHRDLGRVHGDRQRHAVEVAAAHHVETVRAIAHHQRVVGHRAKLALDHAALRAQLVHGRAQHLRRASQCVGILHANVVLPVRGQDLRALQQEAQAFSHHHLAGLASRRMNAWIERRIAGHARVDAHGGGADGGFQHGFQRREGQRAARSHQVRAIEQRQAFLGFQHHWLQATLCQRRCGGHACAFQEHFALAQHR